MLLKVENRENEFNIKMRLKVFFCSTGDTIFKVNFMNYIECFFLSSENFNDITEISCDSSFTS